MAAGKIHSAGERAREATSEAAEKIAEQASRAKEHVVDYSRELTDTVTDYVSKHPLASLGIAVGVGILLGAAMRR